MDEAEIEEPQFVSFTLKNTSHNKYNRKCIVESKVKINNLQDDGINELTKSLPQIFWKADCEYSKAVGSIELETFLECKSC